MTVKMILKIGLPGELSVAVNQSGTHRKRLIRSIYHKFLIKQKKACLSEAVAVLIAMQSSYISV